MRGVDAWQLALGAINEHKAVQKPQELSDLIERLNGHQLDRVLEIGCQEGGTFWLWKQLSNPESKILGLDRDLYPFDLGLITEQHLVWEYDSHGADTRAAVEEFFGGQKLDLLFLDGDHSYAGIRRDYEIYEPLVRDGGLVVFHDIAEHPPKLSEVHRFWQELPAGDKWESRFDNATVLWNGGVLPADSCGIGVLPVVR